MEYLPDLSKLPIPQDDGRAVSFSVQKCDRQILKAFLCKEKEDYFNSFDIFCLNRA
jgi:hypothetical protein